MHKWVEKVRWVFFSISFLLFSFFTGLFFFLSVFLCVLLCVCLSFCIFFLYLFPSICLSFLLALFPPFLLFFLSVFLSIVLSAPSFSLCFILWFSFFLSFLLFCIMYWWQGLQGLECWHTPESLCVKNPFLSCNSQHLSEGSKVQLVKYFGGVFCNVYMPPSYREEGTGPLSCRLRFFEWVFVDESFPQSVDSLSNIEVFAGKAKIRWTLHVLRMGD